MSIHTYAHTGTYERESLKNIETVNLTETEAGKKKINVTSRPYPQGVPEIPDKFKKKQLKSQIYPTSIHVGYNEEV